VEKSVVARVIRTGEEEVFAETARRDPLLSFSEQAEKLR